VCGEQNSGGENFNVSWHVDNLKLSHMSKDEVTRTIEWMKSIYGQDMLVSRGGVIS
jgi:hypothetical protein